MDDAKLCVMQVLPALESGGVERGTVEITAALTQAGHRALVISAGGVLVKEIEALGGQHHNLSVGRKSLFSLSLVSKLRQLLLDQKVTHLHLRSRWPAWLAWLAWRSLPITIRPRLVTTVHGFYSVNAYSAIMVRGERVICVSTAIQNYVLNHYPQVEHNRLMVIPRGIDHRQFTHGHTPDTDWLGQWHRQYPACTGRELLLLPGRITRLKGHHDFLALMTELIAAGRNVHGLIVGAENPNRRAYAQELRQAVKVAGLQDRVSFLGARSDLRDIMALSSLVLSLSTQPESFGRTTLEALSLGRPVLGYAHGGVEEVLSDVYPAGLTPVADRQALLCNAIKLLDHPPLVAPSHAYDLAQMQAQTLALYQSLSLHYS